MPPPDSPFLPASHVVPRNAFVIYLVSLCPPKRHIRPTSFPRGQYLTTFEFMRLRGHIRLFYPFRSSNNLIHHTTNMVHIVVTIGDRPSCSQCHSFLRMSTHPSRYLPFRLKHIGRRRKRCRQVNFKIPIIAMRRIRLPMVLIRLFIRPYCIINCSFLGIVRWDFRIVLAVC